MLDTIRHLPIALLERVVGLLDPVLARISEWAFADDEEEESR